MARITVEDCLARIPNRFALTILASRRARTLLEGRGTALVHCENKEAVTALREISAEKVRCADNLETVLQDFIEDQRQKLRSTATDNTFLEVVSFGEIEEEGEEGEDLDNEVEELTADLELLGTKNLEKDDEESTEEEPEAETEEVVEEALEGPEELAETTEIGEIDELEDLEDLEEELDSDQDEEDDEEPSSATKDDDDI